jgi:PITH domain
MNTCIESDADEQLILYVPFISLIKLKSIAILGFGDNTNPTEMRAFINRSDIDFDSVDSIEPTQTFEIVACPPREIVPEYPTKLTKFTNVMMPNTG